MGKASRTKRERPVWSRDTTMTALVSRLANHEALVESYCPGGLMELDKAGSDRRPGQLGWPGWCWVPTAVSDQVAALRCDPSIDDQTRLGVGQVMSFVGAWRLGKGIYRVSPEFAGQLHATRLPDALPGDVLLQFPEWCVYIPMQPVPNVVGAYVRLDWDLETERPLLGLLFDIAPEDEAKKSILVNLDLFLDHDSLSSALSELIASPEGSSGGPEGVPVLAVAARPFVDVALYLCSLDADAVTRQNPAARPRHHARPAGQPSVWDVGYRVAELLRRPGVSKQASPGAERPSPAPHMRRAHWHTYLVGKGSRADPSTARRELRWVHPTLVGTGDRVPVVRHLRSHDRELTVGDSS